MKIVLVHTRYFISSGPERYLFNIKSLLESNGHEVIPFSVKHNKNVPSEYEPYFLDKIGSGDEVYGHEYKRTPNTIRRVCGRIIYSFEAKRKMKTLLKAVRPDLVYVLHFQNKISCSVVQAAYEMKIPVVQRISDFGHICQNLTSSFYREKEGVICEKCLHGSPMNNVIYRCVDGSMVRSLIKTTSLYVLNALRIRDKIDAFIFPSGFTRSKYLAHGFDPAKCFLIPTFYGSGDATASGIVYKKYALFVGRLVKEKGLMTLIKAFVDTPYPLKIIGFASDGKYDQELKDYLRDKQHHIEFLGELPFAEIKHYLQECLFTVVPSEWYDNLPNTLLESYAFQKAVVATDIGSLQEAVIDGKTGLLFAYKNVAALRDKIDTLFHNESLASQLGAAARQEMEGKYAAKTHYEQLLRVFEQVLAKHDTAGAVIKSVQAPVSVN